MPASKSKRDPDEGSFVASRSSIRADSNAEDEDLLSASTASQSFPRGNSGTAAPKHHLLGGRAAYNSRATLEERRDDPSEWSTNSHQKLRMANNPTPVQKRTAPSSQFDYGSSSLRKPQEPAGEGRDDDNESYRLDQYSKTTVSNKTQSFRTQSYTNDVMETMNKGFQQEDKKKMMNHGHHCNDDDISSKSSGILETMADRKKQEAYKAIEDIGSTTSFAASTSVGSFSTNTNTNKVLVEPMRWTEQETDNLLMQLEFLGDIEQDIRLFSKQKQGPNATTNSTQKLVDCIHTLVEKKSLQRDDPMLHTLTKFLHAIRLVDLDRVLELLQKQHEAGNMMEDKRVLLLCGPTGSGKTTLLHFLAGTTLEEVEEQGFFHLKPVQFQDKRLKDYETSCCQKHMTKSMQATSVMLGNKKNSDKEIIVCDTPGLGPFESVEEEISNGLGMVSELQRAKSVHPLVILSKESLGSRFVNMKNIIHGMRDQFVLESKTDLEALNYIFSKYDGKHRGRICKQIAVLENVPQDVPKEDRAMFKTIAMDMVEKTTPKANLVLPMEDNHVQYLQDLWNIVEAKDGKDLLVSCASASATQQFKIQLQLTVYDFVNLLSEGDYKLAVHRLHQLQDLAQFLPDAKECAEKAQQAGARHITLVSDLAREMIEGKDFTSAIFRINNIEQLDKEIPGARSSRERMLKKLRKGLKQMAEEESIEACLERLASLSKLRRQQPQTKEFVQQGFAAILKVILRTIEEQDFEKTLRHLEALSMVSQKLPEAGECAWRVLQAMKELVRGMTVDSEFGNLLQFMLQLSKVATVFPDATECIQIGFECLKEKSMELFEAKNCSRFIAQIRQLSELTPFLPFDHVSVNRKKMLLMDTIGEVIDKKDFNTAVDAVQNLQNLDVVLSDAIEIIEGGFESLMRRAVSTIDDENYRQSVGMMKTLCKLLPALPSETESIKRGLKLLPSNVQRVIKSLNLEEAVIFLEELHEVSKTLPEVQEGVEDGFEALLQHSTKLLGKEGSHKKSLEQVVKLGKLVHTLSIPSEVVQKGTAELHQAVQNALEVVDLAIGVDLLHRLNKLRDIHPNFSKSLNGGFEKLIQKAGKPMSSNDFSLALSQLEAVGQIKHKFVLTDDCIDRGIQDVSVTLNKCLQFMEFDEAVKILQKFYKLSRTFPESAECIRLGFEILIEKSVDLFDHKEYSRSIFELKQLGHLFQQLSIPEEAARGNLKCLSALIPEAIARVGFEEANEILRSLTDLPRLMPESIDCVQVAFEALLNASVLAIAVDHWSDSLIEMKQLHSAVDGLPNITESSRRGLQKLDSIVTDRLQNMDFDSAIKHTQDLNELSSMYPTVQEVVQAGFGRLLERTAEAFEEEGFSEGIMHLQKLGNLRQVLEMDEDAVQESRRRVLLHLVGTVQRNVDVLAFNTAVKFLLDLNDIAKVYPEAKEGVQAGFEALLRRAVNNLQEKSYSLGAENLVEVGALQRRLDIDQSSLNTLDNIVPTIQSILEASNIVKITGLMSKLGKLVDLYPVLLECIEFGLHVLWKEFEQLFVHCEYGEAANILKEVGKYQMISPVADRVFRTGMKRMKKAAKDSDNAVDVSKLIQDVRKSLADNDGSYQKGCENLREEMKANIEKKDYRAAANIMERLVTEMVDRFPEATDYARDGFGLVVKAIDSSLTDRDFSNVVEILQKFSKLEDALPEASLCLEYGSSVLKSLFEKSVSEYSFGDTALLIENLHASSGKVKRLQGVMQHGLSVLGKAMEKPHDQEKRGEIIHVIQQFSQSSVPKAVDCARRALKGLWTTVKQSIEEQDYTVAIGLMRQMKEIAQDLPEAGDCVQLAFVALRVRLVKAIDKQNFELTTLLMQQLSALGEELPEAMQCAQFGFEALQERLGKTIADKKYHMVIYQLKYMGRIEDSIPEVADLFKLGFAAISETLSKQIGKSSFKTAMELMEQIIDLAKEREDAMDCMRKSLFAFWSEFEDCIDKKEYRKGVEVMQHLSKLASALPEAEDGVQLGFEVLREAFEGMIEAKNYDAAVALMQDLSKLAYELPEASSCIQNGFELLREKLVKIIEQQDYSTARKLIGKLEQQLPPSALHPRVTHAPRQLDKEADESVSSESLENSTDREHKVGVLRERLFSTIEDNDFGIALDTMVSLSNIEHKVPAASETLELGYTTLKEQLTELVDTVDSKAIFDAIVTLDRETHRLPAISECVQFGLEELQKAVEKAVEDSDYSAAIDLMNILCKLSREVEGAFDFTQTAFNGAIQFMAIVREETVASFDELGTVKDNKKFAHMLETACENLEDVMATEELRSFCTHLDKTTLGTKDSPRTLESTLRLATSHTFCKEQITSVAHVVSSFFPELMVDSAHIVVFTQTRDDGDELLAVLERLSLLRKALGHCPGAASMASIQSEAFSKFTCFLDGVISLAQTEFIPRMNLKAFETQVILVNFLIDGFLDSKGSISGEEQRKMEDLEHRQERLLLRFEIEVADALEVICDHKFPTFDTREKMSSYIRTMRVSQLQKHRETLLACVNSRELASMISENVDVSSADRTLSSFDKSLDKFLGHLISLLEDEKERIEAMPKTKGGAPIVEKELVQNLGKDVLKLTEEIMQISSWPTEVYSMDITYYLSRLKRLEDAANDMIKEVEEMNRIGFGSFLAHYVSGLKVPDFQSMNEYTCAVKTTQSGEE